MVPKQSNCAALYSNCCWQQAAKDAQLTFQMAVRCKFELSPFCLFFMFSIWRGRVASVHADALPALFCLALRANPSEPTAGAGAGAGACLSLTRPQPRRLSLPTCLPTRESAVQYSRVQYCAVSLRCSARSHLLPHHLYLTTISPYPSSFHLHSPLLPSLPRPPRVTTLSHLLSPVRPHFLYTTVYQQLTLFRFPTPESLC